MKTIKIMLLSLLALVFWACKGQNQKDKLAMAQMGIVTPNPEDTLNKPRIEVKVNRQMDDKGNLVSFDSTYSYSYSSSNGLMNLKNDSLSNSFRSFFDMSHQDLMDRSMRNLLFNDPLFKQDPFNDTYFQKRLEWNEKMFDNMYRQMDSIKHDFFEQSYPNGYQKKNKI